MGDGRRLPLDIFHHDGVTKKSEFICNVNACSLAFRRQTRLELLSRNKESPLDLGWLQMHHLCNIVDRLIATSFSTSMARSLLGSMDKARIARIRSRFSSVVRDLVGSGIDVGPVIQVKSFRIERVLSSTRH